MTDELPRRYRELSPAHERYDVEGGGAVKYGSRIDCRERARDQEVRHLYVVRGFERDRHMYLASLPSKTFIHLPRRTIEGESETHVYYDLADAPCGTALTFSLYIVLPSLPTKWLALATGSRSLWREHVHEELRNLAQLVEAAAPATQEAAQA